VSEPHGFDQTLAMNAMLFAVELMREGQKDFYQISKAVVRNFHMTAETFAVHIRSIYVPAWLLARDLYGVEVSECARPDEIDLAMARLETWFPNIANDQIALPSGEQVAPPTENDLRALMGLALTAPTPDAIMNFTGFVNRMRQLAPFNVQMVYAQRPGARRVASRKEWEDIGRQVRPGAIPIVVLRTMGPIEYVFEELDTDPPIERQPESDVFAASGAFEKQRLAKLIDALASNSKRHLRVRVHLVKLGANLAGWVNGQQIPLEGPEPLVERGRPGKGDEQTSVWDISVNANLTPAEQFVTLLHELGHLFCGHVGPFADNNAAADEYGWPDRRNLPKAAKEVEAELVAWWLANREGLTTGSPLYLRHYMEKAEEDVPKVDLDRVTRAVARIRSYIGDRGT